METSHLIATAALSTVLPISVFALYGVLKRHSPLAPTSAADAAVLQRFESAAELASFQAEKNQRLKARQDQKLALYREIMKSSLHDIDPQRVPAFRAALESQPDTPAEFPAQEPAPAETRPEPDSDTTPVSRPHVSLWRRRANGARASQHNE